MLKDIKIIDKKENEIKPVNHLVVIPLKDKNEFVSVEEARDLIRIIKGQLNILEAQKIVRKTGDGKDKKHSDRKTGSAT